MAWAAVFKPFISSPAGAVIGVSKDAGPWAMGRRVRGATAGEKVIGRRVP